MEKGETSKENWKNPTIDEDSNDNNLARRLDTPNDGIAITS